MDEASVTKDEVSVVIRDYRYSDQSFIYASWRNATYYGHKRKKKKIDQLYFLNKTRKIKDILLIANLRIACLSDDPELIIGYSVFTGPHLDFIYVKKDFRKKGIGTMLMPKGIETVTNDLTKIGEDLVAKKKLKVREE